MALLPVGATPFIMGQSTPTPQIGGAMKPPIFFKFTQINNYCAITTPKGFLKILSRKKTVQRVEQQSSGRVHYISK
jgi:hypothetical protein